MGYDDVISHIGEIGPYQRRVCVVNYLPALSYAMHVSAGIFLTGKPEFRCLTPDENQENATYHLQLNMANITYPWEKATQRWSRCERYNISHEDHYQRLGGNFSSTTTVVKCDSFAYDKSLYGVTATTEWNLVCDDGWFKTVSESLFMLGVVLGVLTFGALSDRYGRKKTLIWGSALQLIFGLLVAASPYFAMFIICRVVLAMSTSGLYIVAYVAGIEMVYQKKKFPAGTATIFTVVGNLLAVGLACFIRNWRILQLAFTAPTVLFLVSSWSLPESARWLLSKDRVEEAKNILHKASMENGVELPQDALDELLTTGNRKKPNIKKSSLLDIFRYPDIRKRSLILAIIWFFDNFTYYGLFWNTPKLGGSVYVNSVIFNIAELPASLSVIFTIDKYPRKIVLSCCMMFAAMSLLSTIFVPDDMSWLVTVLVTVGKMVITVSSLTLVAFASELYPTTIRNIGVGMSSTIGNIGGVVAPVIISLSEIATVLPFVTFGCCTVLAVFLLRFLPETSKRKLQQTIEEVENSKKQISSGR